MKNVLALIPNWIGDAAMCTPALRAVHRTFRDATLTVAGRSGPCRLLEGIPWIDQFVIIDDRSGPLRMWSIAQSLSQHATDLTVVFPHSARAALLSRLTGSRRRIGYARGGRSFLLTDLVEPHRLNGSIEPIYMGAEYLNLVRPLGCEDDAQGLELHADPALVSQIRERISTQGPIVGIAPGAAFGPSKLWPAERYAAVADALAETAGARCVVLTGPGEEQTRKEVMSAMKTPPLELYDGAPTLDSLKAVVSALKLLICNDSGARHVAVAFGVPTVCIMGPTKPAYSSGPYERGDVLRVDVDCGPCQRPTCRTDHRCMTRIPTERVLEAALNWLGKSNESR